MGRLKSINPLVGKMKPLIGYAPADEKARSRYRDSTQAWRAWYKTSRWQKLRWSILVRDLFTCAECGILESDTSQLVCDHLERHQGDEAKFLAGPFQTLCKPCHDHRQAAGRAERTVRLPGAEKPPSPAQELSGCW